MELKSGSKTPPDNAQISLASARLLCRLWSCDALRNGWGLGADMDLFAKELRTPKKRLVPLFTELRKAGLLIYKREGNGLVVSIADADLLGSFGEA